jgi:AGCS family alanine or glycine:cation symporter
MGYAFLFGMKRALFSNEAGQGTSPMAHSAAKTDEPVREGVVAGLEPFIDTIVVCTLTALVILSTGIWQREAVGELAGSPRIFQVSGGWTMDNIQAPESNADQWAENESVFVIVDAHENRSSANRMHRLYGTVVRGPDDSFFIEWNVLESPVQPTLRAPGIYKSYVGATLTAKAFDSALPGLGKWLVTISVWMFALSTMISWSYYGEQATIFLVGDRGVLAYKAAYCALIIVATAGFIDTDAQLDNLTGLGTGVMLIANLPIMWIFGRQAMRAYKDYIARLKSGQMGPDHPPPSLDDLLSGRDVQKD